MQHLIDFILELDKLKAVYRKTKPLGQEQDLWLEFDDETTHEAQFAHALDRAMPALLNLANNGQSWRENGIGYDTVVERLREPVSRGCPQLWTYMEAKLADARDRGYFGS